MLMQMNDPVNDGLNEAEVEIAGSTKTDQLTTDSVLLCCEFQTDEVGAVEFWHGAIQVLKPDMVGSKVDVAKAEGHRIRVIGFGIFSWMKEKKESYCDHVRCHRNQMMDVKFMLWAHMME